jgi:GT2 family glycosyltransferase
MIDLCVTNYNTLPLLQRLMKHLEIGPQDYRLHISDNGSTDGTGQWFDEMPDPDGKGPLHTVILNENIGYAAACNQLARYGEAEFIGLLNSDVWLTGLDVKHIEEAFAETGADIIGPKQRDETGVVRHAGIFGTNTAPKHRGWRVLDPEDKLYRDRLEAVTVSGSAYFIRRSVWEALTNDPEYQALYPGVTGAFLPTPHYYEETWCSYFARHRGYNLLYDGTVSIGHTWHASAPVRGGRDNMWNISQKMFRDACDTIGIERD